MSFFSIRTKAEDNDQPGPEKGDNLVFVTPKSLIDLRRAGESLLLKASRIASQQSGNYLSRFKGRGMEFDEARPYLPGDDMRTLDWRVTARTGKPHTKLFREERERSVLTWVDMRPTMFFATRGVFKSVLAAQAAALIAWSTNKLGDRLGGLVFNAENHHESRPRHGKTAVLQMLQQLSAASQWRSQYNEQEPDASTALARLRRVAKPGSLIFLISDFRNLGSQAESHLSELARHNDVVMLHIYDELECTLPDKGQYQVSWGQRKSSFNGTSRTTQNKHQQLFVEHQDRLRSLCRLPGMHYISCATHEDILATLQAGLGINRK